MTDLASLYIKVDSQGVVTASRDLDNLTGKSEKTEKATTALERGFQKLAATMKTLAFAVVVASIAATTYALKKSIEMFANFEKELANVSTLINTDVISMAKFQKELFALNSNLGSTTELTKGLYQALSAGVDAAKAVEFVGKAALAAKAGLSDTFTAVDAGTTILNAFGMATKQATFVYDLMFTTVKEGKTTFSELASSIGKISPIASAAGVSVTEMHAALATLTKGGFKTSEASARLATALGTIIKPSSEAQKLTEKLGLEFNATALRTKGLHGFLQDVAKATGGNVDQLALLFGGMESLSVMLALTGKQSQEFTDILKRMGDVSGATKEAFDKQKVTLTALWDTFKNTIGKQAILLGEKLAPKIKEIIDKMTVWFDKNKNMIEQNPQVIKDIGEFVKNVLNLATAMGKVIKLGVEFTNVWVKTWQAMGLASTGMIDFRTAMLDGATAVDTFNETLGPEKLRLAFLERIIATGKYTSKVYWEAKRLRELIDALPDIDVAKPKGAVPDSKVTPVSEDVAEAMRIAAAKVVRAEKDKADAIAKASEKIKKAREEINKILSENVYELQLIGKSQYEQDLIQIQKSVQAFREAGASKVDIAKFVASEMGIANANEALRQAEETKRIAEETKQDRLDIWTDYSEIYQTLLVGETEYKRHQYTKDLDIYLAVEQAKTGATDQEIEKRKQLILGAYGKGEADDYIDKLAEAASYYKDLTGFEDTYHEKMIKLIEERKKAEIVAGKDVAAANAKALKSRNDLAEEAYDAEIQHIKNQWKGYSDMFEGLGQLYDADSSQRKTLHDIAMAFQVAEQAMLLVTAVRTAVVAITTQGAGDPYTAFARVAAMTGLMAATLAKAGISFGGGGGGASASSLPASTVLGAEAGTGSQSIANAWELLEDTYNMEYRELSGIYSEMKNLNANISGLVTSIYRTGDFDSFSISALGSMQSSFDDLLDNDISNLINDLTFGISGEIGDFISDTIGSIFGGGTSKKVTGSGISTGATSVGALAEGGGIGGQEYADIKKTTEGGWFHSDKTKRYTKYYDLDESTSELFDKVFQDMSSTLIELTLGLGTDMDATLNYVFEETKINLKDMDSDEINEALTEYFSVLGDNAADALFGDLIGAYQQVGEGLMETAARVLIDKAVVLEALEMTGQAFTGTMPEIIEFSEAIISMAGDLETLYEDAEKYYNKFFSDAEKQYRLQEQLVGALSDLNMTLPSARDGYRALIEGLDLTTEAGQEAYISLLSMSESADDYYSNLEQLTENRANLEIQLMELQGDAVGALATQRANELAAMDESLRSLQTLIYAEQDLATIRQDLANAQQNVNDKALAVQKENNDRVIAAQQDLANAQQKIVNAQQKIVNEAQGYVDKLRVARESMLMENITSQQAWQEFNTVLAQARMGDLSGIADIDKVLSILTSHSTEGFSTSADYQRNFYDTYKSISELEDLAGVQLSTEKQTLSLLQKQLNGLTDVSVTAREALTVALEQEAIAKEALNVAQAQQAEEADYLSTLITQQELTAREALTVALEQEAIAKEALNVAQAQQATAKEILAALNDAYQANPQFALGGIATGQGSGYDEAMLHGTELVVSPSASYPAKVMGADSPELLAEVKKLREEMRAGNFANVKNSNKIAKILTRFDDDGIPAERSV